MLINNNLILTCLIFIFCFSCSNYKKSEESVYEQSDFSDETVQKQSEEEKKTLTDLIILRDIYNREIYPLKKICSQMPVFIVVSASWCSACKDMSLTVLKLQEYFKGKIFFVKIFMAGDAVSEEGDSIPSMEIISSPENLNIQFSQALPRVIVIDRNGKEVIADIFGIYPVIYYYGLLTEL